MFRFLLFFSFVEYNVVCVYLYMCEYKNFLLKRDALAILGSKSTNNKNCFQLSRINENQSQKFDSQIGLLF